jgi:hypothetical protein
LHATGTMICASPYGYMIYNVWGIICNCFYDRETGQNNTGMLPTQIEGVERLIMGNHQVPVYRQALQDSVNMLKNYL